MPSANRVGKEHMISEVREQIRPAHAAVVAHYSGVTVERMTKLRADLRRSRISLRVIKNTIADRAVEGTDLGVLRGKFTGPTALAFTEADPVVLAKVLIDFAKLEEKFKIQVGVLGGKLINPREIDALSKVPSREILLSRLVRALKSPQSGLVFTLSGVLRKLVYALDAVRRKKEEQGA